MKKLEEKILKDGKILPGGVLKVGNFLNQQIDTPFMKEMGEEIAEMFKDAGVTKILLPKENMKDVEEIPASVSKQLEFIPLEYAKEALSHAIDGKVRKVSKGKKKSK